MRRKGKGGRQRNSDAFLEQPIAESASTVPCQICGHQVDPKRMHPHMVRFHGATLRAKGAWAQRPGS